MNRSKFWVSGSLSKMRLLPTAVFGSFLVPIWVGFFTYVCSWQIREHLEPTQRRYIRNPNKQEFDEGKVLIYTGEEEQYDQNAFVPLEVKAGRIVEEDLFDSQNLISRWCHSHSWSHRPQEWKKYETAHKIDSLWCIFTHRHVPDFETNVCSSYYGTAQLDLPQRELVSTLLQTSSACENDLCMCY